MNNRSQLEAQVAAWNKVNARANELAVTLADAFRPLLGKKIIVNGGGLMEKYKHLCPPRQNAISEVGVDACHSNNLFSLHWHVKASERYFNARGDTFTCYAETSVSVGRIADHILTEVETPCTDRRTDYTADEVRRLREEVEAAEKAFHQAENALSPFTRYDH